MKLKNLETSARGGSTRNFDSIPSVDLSNEGGKSYRDRDHSPVRSHHDKWKERGRETHDGDVLVPPFVRMRFLLFSR